MVVVSTTSMGTVWGPHGGHPKGPQMGGHGQDPNPGVWGPQPPDWSILSVKLGAPNSGPSGYDHSGSMIRVKRPPIMGLIMAIKGP